MEKIHELLNLCVDKGLNISFYSEIKSITVFSNDCSLYISSYYNGELTDFEDKFTMPIDKLIELIKTYKNE